jgi:hypothetical protein
MKLVLVLGVAACTKTPERDKPAPTPPPAPVVPADAAVVVKTPPVDAAVVAAPVRFTAGQKLTTGCFGWSAALDAYACVGGLTGRDGSERTRALAVTFPGSALAAVEVAKAGAPDDETWNTDDPVVLTAATASALDGLMTKHGFVQLAPSDARALAAGAVVDWPPQELALRWKRTEHKGRPSTDGDWKRYADVIQLRCKKAGPFVDVWTHDSGTPVVTVTPSPSGKRVLLAWDGGWGMEGASFHEAGAKVLSLEPCRALD